MAAYIFKIADLLPALGERGGPCKVVNRIQSKGLSPNTTENLTDTVEDDKDLDNSESALVYRDLVERGPHPFTKFVVKPHAQYRMDLRAVTMKDLKESLSRFVQEIEKWRRTGDRRLRELQGTDEFEWVDPKSGLFFAFGLGRRGGDPSIITTYWSQRSTPRTPPGGCKTKNAGYRAPAGDLAGVRTVTDEKPAKGIQDSLGDTIHHPPGESPKSDRSRALPQRTDTKENLTEHRKGPPVYNTPGPSVPMADRETRTPGEPGQSDKIRVRTPGVPGEEYGHPFKDNIYPRRTASDEEPADLDKEAGMFPSYSERQRSQKGDAARYWKRYYRRNRSKIKRRSKMYYRRVRNKPLFKRKRKIRNSPKYRNRFRRLPYGGRRSLSERTRKASPEWLDLDTGFYHPVFGWGDVVGYNTDLDKLVLHLDGEAEQTAVDPLPFLSAAVFDSEASLDEVYGLLDESCADCEDDEPDPRFVAATFYREVFTKGHNLDPGEGVQDLGAPGPESPLYLDYPDDEHHDRKPGERPDFGQVDNNPGSAKVIPEGHDFANRMASSRPSAIRVAAKMAEILQGTAPDVMSRSRLIRPKKKKVNPANLFFAFAVPGSEGDTYAVKMKLTRPRANITDVAKMDAKFSCSCNFWRWQGPEHWAKSGDYLYGKPRGTASRPTEKDPRAEHRVCKHVAAVLDMVRKWKTL